MRSPRSPIPTGARNREARAVHAALRGDPRVVSLYDDPEELVDEADEWEDGWISTRVRNRILRARPLIERHERLVLRTYRA
jgi:hypothetical protein